MNKYNLITIGLSFLLVQSILITKTVKGQNLSTQWGGQGSIYMKTPEVHPGGMVRLRYSINGSHGTEASALCIVVSPNGRTLVKHQSFAMPNGSGSTIFNLRAGNVKGGYIVFCYWYIKGYGINGPTCLAYDTFKVE